MSGEMVTMTGDGVVGVFMPSGLMMAVSFGFFFSSRRRHTRCSRDWSSDVCSSDLFLNYLSNFYGSTYHGLQTTLTARNYHGLDFVAGYTYSHALDDLSSNWVAFLPMEIGRASCRERV